jgi:type I restriction enzyme S subunit
MSEWKKVKLGDVSQYVDDKIAIAATNESYYVSTDSMLKDKRGIIDPESIPLNGNVTKYQSDDILVSNIRPYFKKIWFSNREGGCSNDVLVFRVQKGVASRYLYYILSSDTFFEHMMAGANGTKMPRGNKKLILNYSFDLPPLPIQHRIATILSRYDSLIENYQKQIKLLEEAAQRLYKEWFVDLHFPGHENTKIVNGVLEGWEKKKVGDITPIKTGKKDANFGTSDGAYPFFTCSQEPIKAPSYSFDTSAVILAGNGDFNVKLYRGKFEAYQRTYVLEPTNEKMLYLLYFCISENMNRLATGASGSTIKFLTKGMIESLVFIEPSICVLDSFNQIIEPIRTQKENLQSQIRLLTEARDRLLPKIMSGEIEFNFK